MLQENKTRSFIKIFSFVLIFFVLWTLRQYIYIHVDLSLAGFPKTVFGIFMKIFVWIGLTYFYLKYIFRIKISEIIKISNFKMGIILAFLFGLALLIINLSFNKFSKDYYFNFAISFSGVVSTVIAAPLIEEFVFRGFILRILDKEISFILANLITTILFTAIHFPGWIIWGEGINVESTLSVFAVSFIWGILFKKTNSLHTTVFAHALNNVVTMVV
jgi:membrane protease YdiL (CAAX protease family)